MALSHRDGQHMLESGSRGQNVIYDMAEGTGECSPLGGQRACQKGRENGHNRVISYEACSREKMEGHADYLPAQESASSKCLHNKELSYVPSIPSSSGTKFIEIEIHPRVRRRRHSDTEVSIDKILSLASDKAMDMGENDESSDEDAISVNFAASWERKRYY
ncbi:Uncharacterized protein TCM_039766 [Theobroma cacao]|uniref:Uncharacterized protein n=1 Tax=Theobroma cacao TaxID=3641 RepID=A0A061GS32_THECC|nr:Uncharacterized protein TCM_039766 [Theobroma cacao]